MEMDELVMMLHRSVQLPLSPSPSPQPNLPRGDLFVNRKDYCLICVPLHEAAMKGNWETARGIIEENRSKGVTGCSITENHDTVLHIAASAKCTTLVEDFVRKLVAYMRPEDVQLQNKDFNTALCLAAAGGNVSIAEIILCRNPNLLNIPGSQGMLPLYIATICRQYKMVNYLYEKSDNMVGQFGHVGNLAGFS